MIVSGFYNKWNGTFEMHAPEFPYSKTVYMGYTLNGMKKKYREDFGLKRKRIEWLIWGI